MLKHSSPPQNCSGRVILSAHFQACNTLHPSQALQHEGLRANPPYRKHNPCGAAQFKKPQTTETKGETSEPGQTDAPVEILELQVSPVPSTGHSSPAALSPGLEHLPSPCSSGNGPRCCWMWNEPLSQSSWALHISQCSFPLTHLGFFFLFMTCCQNLSANVSATIDAMQEKCLC